MVHLATIQSQEEYYGEHKKYILDWGVALKKRFVAVHPNEVEYFENENELYDSYPSFKPDAQIVLGTRPMLIDIWEETNDPRYRKEEIEKEISCTKKKLNSYTKKLNSLEEELQELH